MTFLEQLEEKVLLERLVIGLEQPILIKGIGQVQAKIDSGNGGYNVIHGSEFHQQGDTLMFSTVDGSGSPKKISAKVIDEIEVNMGGGNIERRPVIELDIKFAGEDYTKIPFSVSDRSSNTHPILISKGFVEKELEALIDVGAKNISTDGIDVVYGESAQIDQGLMSGIKKGLGAVKSVGKGIGSVAKGIGNTINGANKWMQGGKDVNLFAPITTPIKTGAKIAAGTAAGAVGGALGAAAWTGGKLAKGGVLMAKGLYRATPFIVSGLAMIGGLSWAICKVIAKWSKKLKDSYNNIVRDDISALSKKLPATSSWIKTITQQGATANTKLSGGNKSIDSHQSFLQKIKGTSSGNFIPIVSFSCQKGYIGRPEMIAKFIPRGLDKAAFQTNIYVKGQQGRAKSWQKEIENARKGIEFIKKNKPNDAENLQEEQESLIQAYNTFTDALLLLEDGVPSTTGEAIAQNTNDTPNTNDSNGNDSNGNDPNNPNATNNQEADAANANEAQPDEAANNERQKMIKDFEDLSYFFIWFVPISQDENAVKTITDELVMGSGYDSIYSSLYQGGKVTPSKVEGAVRSIAAKMMKQAPKKRQLMSGMFCLGYAPDPQKPENRDYVFFENKDCLVYNSKKIDINKSKKTIIEFNKKYPKVKKDIQNVENQVQSSKQKLIEKIVNGKAFTNEKPEDYPNLYAVLEKLKKPAKMMGDFNTKYPKIKQDIENVEKAIQSSPQKMLEKIMKGQAFTNENKADFPNLYAVISKIRGSIKKHQDFNAKYPKVKQDIENVEKQVNSSPQQIINKIMSGKAFTNENQEDYPNLNAVLNKIRGTFKGSFDFNNRYPKIKQDIQNVEKAILNSPQDIIDKIMNDKAFNNESQQNFPNLNAVIGKIKVAFKGSFDFNNKYPKVKQDIQNVENAIKNSAKEMFDKIANGQAFGNENQSDYPNLNAVINKIKQSVKK